MQNKQPVTDMKMRKTDYQALKELLAVYRPKTPGFISSEEQKLIEETLEIKERNILDLRNLMDFTIMLMTNRDGKSEEQDRMDINRMSAIATVIDKHIFDLGGKV